MSHRLTIAGVAATVAGVLLLFGQSLGAGGTPAVLAGIATFTSTPLPPTCVVGQTCNTSTPVPTETPGRLKTQTPSATPTATSTMAPSTPAATNTAAATNTPKPGSGNEGAAVKPPNTGSGGAAPGNGINWFLGLGALLVIAGGGAALVGVKQRR